jgi:hypothetical protein
MMTLRRFVARQPDVPMATAWYLAGLAEAKGRQQLFTRQSPQRLKALREHAMIESAVSSNRIEGVEIDADRVRDVERMPTVKESLTVQQEGTRSVQRRVEFYNLDVIISVGYRVKSHRGTQFRIWATQRLREYIVKGFVLDDERLKNPDQPFDYFEELTPNPGHSDLGAALLPEDHRYLTPPVSTTTPRKTSASVSSKRSRTRCIGRSPARPLPRSFTSA